MAGLILAMVLLATGAQAAPPLETVTARLVAVDVAGREIVANGVTWALSSTVKIAMPGKPRASLGDLKPGMHVRFALVSGDDPMPVVRSLTVLPD
ncbi:MAG: hypothetical protein ABI661_07390 [Gammaproteobacteria bacterium]